MIGAQSVVGRTGTYTPQTGRNKCGSCDDQKDSYQDELNATSCKNCPLYTQRSLSSKMSGANVTSCEYSLRLMQPSCFSASVLLTFATAQVQAELL